MQRIAIKYKKCGIYAAFLLIIWIKPRVTYHYVIRFQIVSPAKPKKLSNEKSQKNYRIFAQICSTSQNLLALLRVHETQLLHYTKYQSYWIFFAKILAEMILNLYDHSMRVIWSFSERNKIQLGTENKLTLYKLKSFIFFFFSTQIRLFSSSLVVKTA